MPSFHENGMRSTLTMTSIPYLHCVRTTLHTCFTQTACSTIARGSIFAHGDPSSQGFWMWCGRHGNARSGMPTHVVILPGCSETQLVSSKVRVTGLLVMCGFSWSSRKRLSTDKKCSGTAGLLHRMKIPYDNNSSSNHWDSLHSSVPWAPRILPSMGMRR
jgi:hypothetical protein